MLYIKNTTLYSPLERLDNAAVLVDGGRIVAVGYAAAVACPPGAQVLDADGLLLTPGFIDMQFNGGFGDDFTADPTTIWQVAAGLPRWGVTAFLPTVITSPLERIAQAQQVVLSEPAGFRGATPLGLHVEGPFLNPQKKGAHNPAYLQLPALEAVAGWSPQTGVRLVTLAPELPGALPVIEALATRGVLVSAGHSTATFEEATMAFDAGARYGTHLFNAMPTMHHREPGLPGALLTDPRPVVGFIADGVHTHPSVISLVWQALGPERLNLVTDAMAALGMGPGSHLLGDFEVTVDATSARLADGTLAGSILSLDQALRNLIRLTGCTLADALATVTTTPARSLGLDHERGQIAPGYVADLVLLSPELEVRGTVVRGELVYTAE
ncbi:MAG TPA: N-acetylglucosamine-6-phosphate deacetylase [Anaerolineae bacterium]|nr:N-acetylglucosamine-6-phosphate deacetylase [Anaerolineae bacterium]